MGTRLGQLTKSMPKPMVKFIDKPILEYQINYLKRNNFTDINILLSYKGDVISNYFGDGSNWGVTSIIITMILLWVLQAL